MARVPASERTRNALKDMFAGKTASDKSNAATTSMGPIDAATATAAGSAG
jgi:hypothetical protein